MRSGFRAQHRVEGCAVIADAATLNPINPKPQSTLCQRRERTKRGISARHRPGSGTSFQTQTSNPYSLHRSSFEGYLCRILAIPKSVEPKKGTTMEPVPTIGRQPAAHPSREKTHQATGARLRNPQHAETRTVRKLTLWVYRFYGKLRLRVYRGL